MQIHLFSSICTAAVERFAKMSCWCPTRLTSCTCRLIITSRVVSGESYSLFTAAESSQQTAESYGWFYVAGSAFQFQLQTCDNAEITLVTTPLDANSDGYKINIGSRSSITRISSGASVSADTSNLLQCFSVRILWLAWSEGSVSIGHGKLNENKLIELQDSMQQSLVAVKLSTPQSAGGGEWHITKSRGT